MDETCVENCGVCAYFQPNAGGCVNPVFDMIDERYYERFAEGDEIDV